jgi:hypothetical protein
MHLHIFHCYKKNIKEGSLCHVPQSAQLLKGFLPAMFMNSDNGIPSKHP